MAFGNPIIGASDTLIRNAIQSENFVTGVSGWRITRDGDAEFNSIVIRGSTTTNGVILIYNGTPGAGNLIASIAPSAGTDAFGNAYRKGVTVQESEDNYITQNVVSGYPEIEFNPDATTYDDGIVQAEAQPLIGGGRAALDLISPAVTATPVFSRIQLWGGSVDGTLGTLVDVDADEVDMGSALLEARGVARYVVTTAAENVNNSAVMQDDDELFISLDANSVYEVELFAGFGTAVNCDLRTAWSGPAGVTGNRHCVGATQTAAAFTSRLNTASQYGERAITTTVIYQLDAGSANQTISERGIITTTNAGLLRFRFCQDVATPGNLTRNTNSWFKYTKISG